MEEVLVRARSYVLWLLARKDYSRRQLEEKLKKRELSPLQISELLEKLKDDGFYQEDRFKKVRTRQLMKRGYGPRMIVAKLRQEKISLSKEDMGEALDFLQTTQNIQVKEQIEKLLRRYRSQELDLFAKKQKIIQTLLRKGFSITVILESLKEVDFNSDT